ncbi:MAG: YkgJ family cysteine cluster protein [Planctomycetales bacterium]
MSAPPWYHEGLRFECTQCGDCCSGEPGFVWVSDEEILRMAKRRKTSVADFEKQYVRLVGSDKSLRERPDGDCVFLDPESRGCGLYEDRPDQCRTWPFWRSNVKTPEAWEKTCSECPGAGKGNLVSLESIQQQVREVDL